LEYPKELHDLHNDYPVAPENIQLKAVSKLIPNLNDKRQYILHYANLKLYESLGLKIRTIHRRIRFEESKWLKTYIDLNMCLRTKELGIRWGFVSERRQQTTLKRISSS